MGNYIVRPIINLLGMGREAKVLYLQPGPSDEIAHPSSFWCELFSGRHLSVDYKNENQVLCVEGFRYYGDPLYKFCKWKRVDDKIPYPEICKKIRGKYETINVEFIGDKLIEIHLRENPDFQNEYTELIPVWNDTEIDECDFPGFKFITSQEYKRLGFYVK
jgi:hypothetical protein